MYIIIMNCQIDHGKYGSYKGVVQGGNNLHHLYKWFSNDFKVSYTKQYAWKSMLKEDKINTLWRQ
jgi:hypothetical protein